MNTPTLEQQKLDVDAMTEEQVIAAFKAEFAAMHQKPAPAKDRHWTPREKLDRKLPMTDAEWAALPNHVRNRHDREKWKAKPTVKKSSTVQSEAPRKVTPTLPAVDPVDFPIDMVYLWCDGSDPAFAAEAKAHGVGTGGSRFVDCGELRYSLRSVERFAPWVRTIHLVTNGQVPAWLRRDHPKIRLVTHRDIFAWPEHLPTFSSVAIEQHIHRIPGLTEHFLYANDDCLFGCPLQPGHFFTSDGRAKLGMSGLLQGDNGYTQTLTNAAAVLAQQFGTKHYRRAIHHIQPLRKSALAEIVERCPDVARHNSELKARRRTNVALNLGLWPEWMLNTSRAVTIRISSHYVNANKLTEGSRIAQGHPLICVNNSTPAVAAKIRGYLSPLLPVPSKFEVPAAPGRNGRYQPVWINGQTLRDGKRESEQRYAAIRPILDKFTRPFTVLDIGCNMGYFCNRIAADYSHAVVIGIEGDDRVTDALVQITRENASSRVSLIRRKLSLTDLQSLADCEHFDVVLALSVVHHFNDPPAAVIDAITGIGEHAVIELATEPNACGQQSVRAAAAPDPSWQVIGYGPSALVPGAARPIYHAYSPKPRIKRRWMTSRPKGGSVEVESDFSSKRVRILHDNGQIEERDFIAGMNLRNFLTLGGIFPAWSTLADSLQVDGMHGDVHEANFILQGSRLVPIDVGYHQLPEGDVQLVQLLRSALRRLTKWPKSLVKDSPEGKRMLNEMARK